MPAKNFRISEQVDAVLWQIQPPAFAQRPFDQLQRSRRRWSQYVAHSRDKRFALTPDIGYARRLPGDDHDATIVPAELAQTPDQHFELAAKAFFGGEEIMNVIL